MKKHSQQVIDLASIKLDAAVYDTLTEYKAAGTPDNGLRLNDYRRWSVVLSMLDGGDLLDIGIGMGQFPTAAMKSKRFSRVVGADVRPHTSLRNTENFELIKYDLTKAPGELSADIVTCMECIEHIDDRFFQAAVDNLIAMARKRLIVTVPFEEPLPLSTYHKQRFDEPRLKSLFPGCQLRFLKLENRVQWALVDLIRS